MGYEISYQLHKIKRMNLCTKRIKIILTILALAVLAIFIHWLGCYMQMSLLGQTDTARAAAEQMVQELKSGTDFKDAVAVFCTEILK